MFPLSPIKYPYFNSAVFVQNLISRGGFLPPVFRWLAFGKLPENPIVTPTSSVQVVRPSAVNKFLQTVTVEAIPTTTTEG